MQDATELRGTTVWAPPRAQVIFTVHPPQRLAAINIFPLIVNCIIHNINCVLLIGGDNNLFVSLQYFNARCNRNIVNALPKELSQKVLQMYLNKLYEGFLFRACKMIKMGVLMCFRRASLMAKQKFRCAGCGMKIAAEYMGRLRYCEYLGRYFCTGCHSGSTTTIPGRILAKWDFSKYVAIIVVIN